jgi:hypothetical protein
MLPAWTENNGLNLRNGIAKMAMIRPVLIDREIPKLQSQIDALQTTNMTAAQKQEFVRMTNQLQTLKRRRELLLARTGDDYVIPPPALSSAVP